MVKPANQLALTATQQRDLQRWLSPARLTSYGGTAPGTVAAALDLYVFNMRLAEAMLGPLHVLEVVIRNAMHEQLTATYGRPDWWNAPRLYLVPRQRDGIAHATDKAGRTCAPQGRAVTPDDIVAATDFGFWCGLVDKGLKGQPKYTYERTLWQPSLRHAFPGNRRGREQFHQQLDGLRLLRNRISHHEPIHARDLAKDLRDVILVLGTVSPAIASWVDDRAMLPLVLKVTPGSPSVQHF